MSKAKIFKGLNGIFIRGRWGGGGGDEGGSPNTKKKPPWRGGVWIISGVTLNLLLLKPSPYKKILTHVRLIPD